MKLESSENSLGTLYEKSLQGYHHENEGLKTSELIFFPWDSD